MLKKDGIKYSNLKIVEDTINFRISDTSLVNSLVNDIKDLSQIISQNALSAQNKSNLEIQTNNNLINVSLTEDYLKQIAISAVNQSIEIVRRRIDELGTREPTIQKQGISRILIQLPGLEDPERIKSLLGHLIQVTE